MAVNKNGIIVLGAVFVDIKGFPDDVYIPDGRNAGSGQTSLLDRLNHNFPGIFQANLMVTAFDVKYGKPNPEPYLMALKKGGFKPNEALVIENAPLGVQAGVAAGIFTIAVNTGPLHDNVLLNEGANLLFHSMPDFNENWETLQSALKQD